MATIKSYTDLEQSKVLAEILPLESADMHYWLAWRGGVSEEVRNTPKVGTPNKDVIKTYWCSCWSLASLLDVLPKIINNETLFIETSAALWHIGYRNIYTARADNPVDACCELILKLHELNLL